MSPTQVKRYLYDTVINDFKFEGTDSFTYLGSVASIESKMWTDVNSKIMKASHAYKHTNSSDRNSCLRTLNENYINP
jgi:hypothetical protein